LEPVSRPFSRCGSASDKDERVNWQRDHLVTESWLLELFDPEETAALTAELVAIRSYPGQEGPVQRHIAGWLESNGLKPEFQATEGGRPNVIARIENGAGPSLLLNGHVDTVLAVEGWSSDPWTPRRDGNFLYGLGAADMKSGVAAAMLAARALFQNRERWHGSVMFSSVVDEEAYSIGARALIASGIQADYCVVTESSWDRPALGSVGKTLVRIDVTGKAAHASWPWEGINAATEAARLVARLDEIPLLEHPRMRGSRCVLSFASGNEQYVITVPEKAGVVLNRMIVAGENSASVLDEVQKLIDDLQSAARFDLTIDPPYYPPWETDVEHPLALALASAYEAETGHVPDWGYTGFGDMNLFSEEAGIPTVMIGPRGGNFHQADEWVEVPSIAATSRLLVRMALDLLA
jgi:acetylornithine deacetylase/succinyl-diaminopimelate desuccinylase-like protein